jgi:hypothetical protein
MQGHDPIPSLPLFPVVVPTCIETPRDLPRSSDSGPHANLRLLARPFAMPALRRFLLRERRGRCGWIQLGLSGEL